jgi:hypothetical protein
VALRVAGQGEAPGGLADEYLQFAVEHDDGLVLVVVVVDVHRAAFPRRLRLSASENALPVCSPLRRRRDRAPRNHRATWASGLEITLPVTG